MNDALAFLAEAHWLEDDAQRRGSTPGRHSSDFIVNPAVHGGVNG